MKMAKKAKVHYVVREGIAFEEFVCKALEKKCEVTKIETTDFFLPNGLPEVSQDPCYVEVEYGNNEKLIYDVIERCKARPLVIIYLGNIPFSQEEDRVFILGADYVKALAEDNLSLWWNFISTCNECPEVKINEASKTVYIEWLPLAAEKINVNAELALTQISELSKINSTDFKKRAHDNPNEVSVIIGNGVSIPFGSDLWGQLSDYLFDYLSPKYVDNAALVKKAIGNTTFSSTSMSSMMVDQKKYRDALYSCVYRKYESDMHNSNTLMRAIVNSKVKHDIELITYNYDEFLEKDYEIVTKTKMSSVCSRTLDNKTREPKIKHIHGLIPFGKVSKTSGVVLTQEEYYKAYKGQAWTVDVQKKALERVCLFVGSSLSDLFQMSLINEVKERKEKSTSSKGLIWKCYALMCLKGLTERDIATVYNYYLRKGIYIIFVKDFGELPEAYTELMSF